MDWRDAKNYNHIHKIHRKIFHSGYSWYSTTLNAVFYCEEERQSFTLVHMLGRI